MITLEDVKQLIDERLTPLVQEVEQLKATPAPKEETDAPNPADAFLLYQERIKGKDLDPATTKAQAPAPAPTGSEAADAYLQNVHKFRGKDLGTTEADEKKI